MTRFGPLLAFALLLAPPLGVSWTSADETQSAPRLSPLPRGSGLDAAPGRGPAEEGSSARPAKPGESALADAPHSRADTLNELYARLASSKDPEETSGLIGAIDRLELESGSDAGDLLMARAIAAMGAKDYDVALALLDKLVDLHPEWAEAWNKRATARFLADDERGSMADIAHVLKLEPRHIGALSGLGAILEREGFRDDALRAYQRALQIAPQLESLKNSVDRLSKAVQGEDL